MSADPPRRRSIFRRLNVSREVRDELEFHIGERVDELVARGLDPRVARAEALRAFGDLAGVTATCVRLAEEREAAVRRREWLDEVRQDVRYAGRQVRANPGFSGAVVATLALGIGATTALFSLVNAVLLRPLPYRDGDRIVMLWETSDGGVGRASAGHFHDWRDQSEVLEAAAAWQGRAYTLTEHGDPERLPGARVTPSFFQVQHMPPLAGRYFQPDEAGTRVVVLSHGLWRRRFAADPGVIGQDIVLNGEAHTVIGVTPAGYTLREFDEQLWTPLSFDPAQRANYGAHTFLVLAPLRSGVTLEHAQRDLERVTEEIRARAPDALRDRGVRVESLLDTLVGSYRTQLWVLLGAVGVVLLIACGNVAGLLLARALAREKEFAIRGALGGGRGRIVRQLLSESLLLGLLGGVAGLAVARAGLSLLVGLAPAGVARLREAGLQPDVLAFALAATAICTIGFGLAPAARATRTDLYTTLREGGRSSRRTMRDRVRTVLVVGELAFALLLLVTAGLFLRSAHRLQRVALGFEPAGVTTMRLALPPDRYAGADAVQEAFARLLEHISALPGVDLAAAGTRIPLGGPSIDAGFRIDGGDPVPRLTGHVRLVSDGYTEALGIPLTRGRGLTAADLRSGAPPVVLVNETMARQLVDDGDPIGRRVSGWAPADAPVWREVVGVVGDVRAFGRESAPPPEIYLPYTQPPEGAWGPFGRAMTVVVRTAPGVPIGPALRAAVARVDRTLPLQNIETLSEAVARSSADRRFNTLLLSLLGATGLLLATVGIYGLIAFVVGQRAHEIGVRMVLGARPSDILRLVARQGALLAAVGIGLGAAVSFWATRAVRGMLYDVRGTDPWSYAAAAAVLAVAAVLASVLPAHRATRTELSRSINAT